MPMMLTAALLAVALVSGCGGDQDSGQGAREEARAAQGGQEKPRGATTGGETGMAEGGEKPEAVKALYVPGFVAEGEGLDGVLRLAEETEVNALVVDVKDAGVTTYPSEVPLAQEIGATSDRIPDLAAFVRGLKEKGVYPIARLAVFQDDVLPHARPDLAAIDATTGEPWLTYQGAAWANPYREEAQRYNVEIAKEAAAAGFEEVQFDYVRFPSDGEMVNLAYGEETAPTQEDAIAGFLEYAHGELEPMGVEVSADVFGLVGMNDYVGVGQVVSKMAPHLDVLCPMVYPSHYPPGAYGYDNPDVYPYEIVDLAMADFGTKARAVNPGIEIRPWLQDFDYLSEYEPADVEAQMKATEEAGLKGWILWNANAEYTTEVLKKVNG
ncbi:MAG: hypothetical protein CYG60_16820 [Actinobacteria bacterium]|nr:MAG: hypothetical protein CYG60_16820 [Actinomycetota bacterium]